ncbi:FGGY family carbohydrate kinase [Pseudomonas sp. H2_E05]
MPASRNGDGYATHVFLERLFGITGNSVDSYYGFTKMLWLKQHQPKVWAKHPLLAAAQQIASTGYLAGELAVDHRSAGNIGGVYDVAARGWSEALLAELGKPLAMMPQRLLYGADVAAIVDGLPDGWATRLGLQAGTPVLAGAHRSRPWQRRPPASRISGNHVALVGTPKNVLGATWSNAVDAASPSKV